MFISSLFEEISGIKIDTYQVLLLNPAFEIRDCVACLNHLKISI